MPTCYTVWCSKPVRVVEADLLNDDVHEHVPHSGGERGEGVATLVSPQFHQIVLEKVEEQANNKHIEEDSAKPVFVHLPVYLMGGGEGGGRGGGRREGGREEGGGEGERGGRDGGRREGQRGKGGMGGGGRGREGRKGRRAGELH